MKKEKGWYPGKPGPKPSGGAKRRILFPLALNEDEYEYLNRLARDWKERHVAQKVAGYIRERVFINGWRTKLLNLRQAQGGNIKS